MKHVFAIGGGEIGRPGYPVETLPIDTALIKSTGKKHPRLLFIPTASRDSAGYTTVVEEHFGKRLGCTVDTLCVAKGAPSQKEMRAKVAAADIVYVGGGNTLFMMKRWRACGLDTILSRAAESGTVMSGLSAGAVCWFRFASSDSRMMSDPTYKKYIRVRGLGWYNATLSPHHIRESTRDEGLKTLLKARGGIGIALDDCACLEIRGTQYRIITSQPQARARKVYVRRGKVVEELLKKDTWSDCVTLFS
jgi:dipeptidase E